METTITLTREELLKVYTLVSGKVFDLEMNGVSSERFSVLKSAFDKISAEVYKK